MSVIRTTVRQGAYHDSIVLMQLQSALLDQPGVLDAGVVMATEANFSMLAASRLLPDPAPQATAEDLLVSVSAEDEDAAEAALAKVDSLLTRRSSSGTEGDDYRPRSLRAAHRMAPDARWVLISVPGAFAAEVAREALDLGKNVMLYSDNVSSADEAELKRHAQDSGLLVLGPDCGTAIVGGTGLGFANRVKRGGAGLVAASGTGLQAVASRIDALGAGVSQAIGTGGRDLSEAIGATTALQALDLLDRDPSTRVIVLISKPPSSAVAARVLDRARRATKPVVVAFLGYPAPGRRLANLHFARDLDEAAELAVGLAESDAADPAPVEAASATSEPATSEPATSGPATSEPATSADGRRYLRGLFSGGTLAYEALLGLRPLVRPLSSNLSLDGVSALEDPHQSVGHSIVDLGEDALTVGKLHPMMDPDAARRRLLREAGDPETAVILLDVVLGDVAHLDPAAELASTLAEISEAEISSAGDAAPAVVALLVGTDADPQDAESQAERLAAAGAIVERRLPAALERVLELLPKDKNPESSAKPAPLESLDGPLSVLNVGLDVFHHSLQDQGASSVQVDWRPPAGGNARLMSILAKMK